MLYIFCFHLIHIITKPRFITIYYLIEVEKQTYLLFTLLEVSKGQEFIKGKSIDITNEDNVDLVGFFQIYITTITPHDTFDPPRPLKTIQSFCDDLYKHVHVQAYVFKTENTKCADILNLQCPRFLHRIVHCTKFRSLMVAKFEG